MLARRLAIASVLVVGCGARTGLDEPCVIPLERQPPAVVYLVLWAEGACDNWQGTCPPEDLLYGQDWFQAVAATIEATTSVIDDVARIGAMPTSTLRFDQPLPDLPGGGPNPAICASPTALTVPIADHEGANVARYFSHDQWPHGYGRPNGEIDTMFSRLPVVERALQTASGARGARLLVLLDSGARGCVAGEPDLGCADSPDDCTVIDDAHYEWIRTEFAGLASRGVPTIVVGITGPIDPNDIDVDPTLRVLNAEAEGGGLAQGSGPVLWYDHHNDVSALQRVLREQVLASYYCRLFPTRVVPSSDEPELTSTSASAPEQDTTHTNGWDWLDASHNAIGLFGAACERAMSSDDSYRLLIRAWDC